MCRGRAWSRPVEQAKHVTSARGGGCGANQRFWEKCERDKQSRGQTAQSQRQVQSMPGGRRPEVTHHKHLQVHFSSSQRTHHVLSQLVPFNSIVSAYWLSTHSFSTLILYLLDSQGILSIIRTYNSLMCKNYIRIQDYPLVSYIALTLSPSSFLLLIFYSIYFTFFPAKTLPALSQGWFLLSLMPAIHTKKEKDMDERTKEKTFSTEIIRMCRTHKRHTIERLKITKAASPKACLSLRSFLKGRTPV